MKKIVIFGATGKVGAYTTIDLHEKGYDVIAVGHRNSDNGFYEDLGIPYYSVDITDKHSFEKLPKEGIETVIHFAGLLPAGMKGYYPHAYIHSIVDGTLNVLEYLVSIGAKKIIFSQSRADSNYLMGKTPIPSDIEKHFPLNSDHSIYSICKNAAVDMIEHFHYKYGIQRFELRFPTCYGYHPNPYYHVNGEKRMMGYRLLMDKAMKGEPIEIWGDPHKGKEIVYIKDVVQIIRKCVDSELAGGMYNVGRGVPVTLEEQILGIVDVFCPKDKKSQITYCPEKPDGREYVNDMSKTEKDLGYKAEFNYIEGLKDFKKYMETNPWEKMWGTQKDYE